MKQVSEVPERFMLPDGSPRQQLQQVLAAEMSWHHAALERLTTAPEAMADTDRYVAGEISLTQLVRRIRNHHEPE